MTTINITNPFSGHNFDRDISGLEKFQLDAYAQLMDGGNREELHNKLAPCSPEEFLAAWAERVGPEEAGRVILGA